MTLGSQPWSFLRLAQRAARPRLVRRLLFGPRSRGRGPAQASSVECIGWYGVGCLMADNPTEPPPSGVLRSNVDTHVVADAPKERRAFPITMLLVALLTFVAGGLTVL